MKILFTSASFSSNYGGPAYSVLNLARAISRLDVEVGLWAPDGSAVDVLGHDPSSNFLRLKGNLKDAISSFGVPEIYHDSGLWLFHNIQIALYAIRHGRPLIVSPRGMLEPWALRYKPFRKKVAWHLYQSHILKRSHLLHATSRQERETLKNLHLNVAIESIPNGVDLPFLLENIRMGKDTDNKVALFLGRLHPIKGLPNLIKAWKIVDPQGWNLHIAGPDEDGYRSVLADMIRDLNLIERVKLLESIEGSQKEDVFASASIFVLPSYSESFGMVIAEALARGLPVLTTSAVPWPQLDERNCGWQVAATVEGLTDGLEIALSTSRSERRAMGRRGRALIEAEFTWDAIGVQFLGIYKDVVEEMRGTA